MLSGIDVSTFQNSMSFAGYDFVIVKLSEGVNYKDDKADLHLGRAEEEGKLIGVYHYARPDLGNTAEEEAQSFLNYFQPWIGKAIIALDWEGDSLPYPAEWAVDWLNYVKNATGALPFIYIQGSVENSGQMNPVRDAGFPLWIADWSDSPTVANWSKWWLWQYTDTPYDFDKFNGSVSDWQNFVSEKPLEWISSNEYLTLEQMQNNAKCVWRFFQQRGWTLESVAGMLGNMQTESTINPGVWENLTPYPPGGGAGLVGWTPYQRITDWLTAHGYEFGDGDGECEKIQEEMEHPEIEVTWIATDVYQFSFEEFSKSTADPGYLGLAFLACYERPTNPNQPERGEQAKYWYEYLSGTAYFTPRLDDAGILDNPLWYDDNPFYQAGFGLPNCTCYVWGRWYEILGEKPDLPLGDAKTWYPEAESHGLKIGSTPQLGAIICTYYDNGGHVAVVEQINSDGTIVTSNSGYPSTFFWTETLSPDNNYLAPWMPGEAYTQGFIYLPFSPVPPDPPKPPIKNNPMPFIYYLKGLL